MNPSSLALPTNRLAKAAGETYLKFQLNRQVPAVFSMRHVQEALILPARRLTTMPNMPAPVLGLTNRRNRVSWVVDLPQLLGLSALDSNTQQHTLILVQVGSVPIGFAVQQVEGITRLNPEDIQSPRGQVTSALVPYLRGCILQKQDDKQEVLIVLDAEAIAQSPLLLGNEPV
ncbi:MAG: chemotaxis protein CheW [Oculatellaceae cyanobacterium Prado106]|jgi:twitching motility protein PilI|nr:chemotaxis protein CheW [Oculatellaceae cyanobacterium Prado106]